MHISVKKLFVHSVNFMYLERQQIAKYRFKCKLPNKIKLMLHYKLYLKRTISIIISA